MWTPTLRPVDYEVPWNLRTKLVLLFVFLYIKAYSFTKNGKETTCSQMCYSSGLKSVNYQGLVAAILPQLHFLPSQGGC